MRQTRHVTTLISIFFLVFISHFISKNVTSFDSKWSIHTAMSIIKEGNTDLDEYKEVMNDHRIETINGHFYNLFPVGVSIIAVPFTYILDKSLKPLLSMFPILEKYIRSRSHQPLSSIDVITLYPGVELLVASLIIATAAVFIYLLSCLFMDKSRSLGVVFIFAFCTSAWSTASRGLWQHGPSMLMLTVTLYLILLSKSKPEMIQFAGIPLAFSYVVRPTNSISVILLSIFVFIQFRQYFLRYLLWAMTIAVPFLLYSFSVYHSLLPPYYMGQKTGLALHPGYVEALIANLISPARGLFVFSPVLLFSLYGIYLKMKNGRLEKLDYFLLGILFLHWMLISYVTTWWQGWSFGPRYFSDLIPYFLYFFIPVIAETSRLKGMKKFVLVSVIVCLTSISFFIHYRGANSWAAYGWNSEPVNVDAKPERVWDWQDIQFLRGIRIR